MLQHMEGVRRPLAGYVLAFAAGIALGCPWPAPYGVAAGCAAAAWLAAVFRRRTNGGLLYLTAAAFSLGLAFGSAHFRPPSSRDIRHVAECGPTHVKATGVVAYEPEARSAPRGGPARYRFPLRLDSVNTDGRWRTARGRLQVDIRMDRDAEPPAYGERWRVSGTLMPSRAPHRPPELRADFGGRRLSDGHGDAIMAGCIAARRFCARVLSRGLEDFPEAAHFQQAILLGYRGGLSGGLYRAFSRSGLLHILAISGLHVGVMGLILVFVFRTAGFSRPYWVLSVGPILVLYAMATGLRPSAVRACVMALCYGSAQLFRRRPDPLTALALAAGLLLVFNPSSLFDPGFQFSFIIVWALILAYPRTARLRPAWLEEDPWSPRDRNFARRGLRLAANYFFMLTLASGTAWLASAPLSAYYSNLLSPVAVIGNLAAIPISFIVVMTSCLSIALGSSIPWFAEIFNHANRVFIGVLLYLVERLNGVPFGHRFIASPPAGAVAAIYGGAFVCWLSSRRVRVMLTASAAAAVVLYGAWMHYRRPLTVDVIARGRGASLFVSVPRGPNLLLDRGAGYDAWRIENHLRRCGVNRLDYIASPPWMVDAEAARNHWETIYPGVRRLARTNRLAFARGAVWAQPRREVVQTGYPGAEMVMMDPVPFEGLAEIAGASALVIPRETLDRAELGRYLLDRRPEILVLTGERRPDWRGGFPERLVEELASSGCFIWDLERDGNVRLVLCPGRAVRMVRLE